ncbi:GlcNAc-PI de-N-acetylase [Pseudonocardiaceae bacterium YIM PH 21723]|nr:GlcNAc-PI de-N-acetylase [Pseudonocardiaceae bacterium YIM PH 21723]
MTEPLTIMAVHAHPDDEASGTGGILARYSAEGVRTIVVTCTNGEFGDAPGGIKPGQPGHDPAAVAELRLRELAESCTELGVTHVETLGYHDSGMEDWEYRGREDVFCNVPLATVAAQVAELIEKYRPQVVISYDENGMYQHPDHVHAALAAAEAVKQTGIPQKLYQVAWKSTMFKELRKYWAEDEQLADPTPEEIEQLQAADARLTTEVDVSGYTDAKRASLIAHASQLADSFPNKIPQAEFGRIFQHEYFVRSFDTTGASVPETDLFAGIR